MKKTIALLMCFTLAVCTLCACGDPTNFSDKETLSNDYTRSTDPAENYNYNDGATSAPMSYNVYSSSIANFELRMFRNYYSQNADKTKSSVFAPAGAALQLSLLANGATGNTQDEIRQAIGKDLTVENINQCSSYFKSRMEAVSKSGSGEVDELSGKKEEKSKSEYVSFGLDLFFNDTSDVKTSFLQTNASYFGNDVYRFLFSDENSVSKVNKSFTDFTSNNLFESLNEKDSLFLVNACDMSDLWLDNYSKSDIEKGTFKSNSGDKSVNFMTSNESPIKTDKAQGIVKYTSKNPLKLMIVMPNEGVSLDEYVSDFNYTEFSNLLDSFDFTKKVKAQIPEFSIASDEKPQALSEILADSGLYTLFTDDALFKNITHTDNFMLNEIYEVTPEITVNASGINSDSKIVDKRVKELEETKDTIRFDRPFIFLLIDNESSIPVYIGTVDNI